MRKTVFVVYANYYGCEPKEWWVYETLRAAEIGASMARNEGMDAFIKEEEE